MNCVPILIIILKEFIEFSVDLQELYANLMSADDFCLATVEVARFRTCHLMTQSSVLS